MNTNMTTYKNILIGLLVLAIGLSIIAGGDIVATILVGLVLTIAMIARFTMYNNIKND